MGAFASMLRPLLHHRLVAVLAARPPLWRQPFLQGKKLRLGVRRRHHRSHRWRLRWQLRLPLAVGLLTAQGSPIRQRLCLRMLREQKLKASRPGLHLSDRLRWVLVQRALLAALRLLLCL
jgi:hypothetical protein